MLYQKNWLRLGLKKQGFSTIYEFCKEHPSAHNHILYRWNSLKSIPNIGSIMKLCHVLKCTPNDLLLHTEEEYYYV